MDQCLQLPEIAAAIVRHFQVRIYVERQTLLALARTSRVLSDASLDALWSRVNVWYLAQRMDPNIWHIHTQPIPGSLSGKTVPTLSLSRNGEDSFGLRFTDYARRVQVLWLGGDHKYNSDHVLRCVAPNVIAAWTTANTHTPLFPRLRKLEGGAGYVDEPLSIRHFLSFVSHNITSLDITMKHEVPVDAVDLARLNVSCTHLQQLSFATSWRTPVNAQLASALLTASLYLRHVTLGIPVRAAHLIHLGQCRDLVSLTFRFDGTPVPVLSHDAFSALQELSVIDCSSTAMALQFCLNLSPTSKLLVFSYSTENGAMIDRTRRNHLFSWIAKRKTLTSVGLEMSTAHDPPSEDDDLALLEHLRGLPALERIVLRINAWSDDDLGTIERLLDACPKLTEWTPSSTSSGFWGTGDYVSVSFRTFLTILARHPRVRLLPVCLDCRGLPSLVEVGKARYEAYGQKLHIKQLDGRNISPLAALIEQVLPGIVACECVIFDTMMDPTYDNVDRVNDMLERSRKSSNGLVS